MWSFKMVVNLPFHRHENNLLSTSCTIWKKVVVVWKNKTYVPVSCMQEFRYKIHVFLFFYFSFCDFLSQSLSHHKNSMARTRIIVKSSWVLVISSWSTAKRSWEVVGHMVTSRFHTHYLLFKWIYRCYSTYEKGQAYTPPLATVTLPGFLRIKLWYKSRTHYGILQHLQEM